MGSSETNGARGYVRGGGESSLSRTVDVVAGRRHGSVTMVRESTMRNVTNVFRVQWGVSTGRGWRTWSKRFGRDAGRTVAQREQAAAAFAATKLGKVTEWAVQS